MKPLVKIGIFSLFFGFGVSLFAQDASQTEDDDVEIRRLNDFVIGGGLQTMGWGVTARYGQQLTVNKRRLYEASFLGFKHPKETRRQNDGPQNCVGGSNSAYVYGKQNSFYTLRTGLGTMSVLYKKADENGVEVRYFYSGGASLGVLKPYYLEIIHRTDDNRCYVEHEAYNSDVPIEQNKFMKRSYIYGSSGFSYGLSEMRIHPGAYGKAGLNFEWSNYHDMVKAIEIGAAFDLYYKRVPIMIAEHSSRLENKQLFATLYVDILFGWNW